MAKKRTLAEDKGVLEKKVRERRAASQNPEGEKDVRRLRKRLKRVQRKIPQSNGAGRQGCRTLQSRVTGRRIK